MAGPGVKAAGPAVALPGFAPGRSSAGPLAACLPFPSGVENRGLFLVVWLIILSLPLAEGVRGSGWVGSAVALFRCTGVWGRR